MEARMLSSLDRYITGNYGEDQFKGEADWEDFVSDTCDRCIFWILRQCPVEYPYDLDPVNPACLVMKSALKEHEDALIELDRQMEEQFRLDEMPYLGESYKGEPVEDMHVTLPKYQDAIDRKPRYFRA